MDASPVVEARPRPRPGWGSGPRGLAAAESLGPLLLVGALTVLGIVLRVVVAHDPLFADELSTTWIVEDHGLGGVLSTVHSNAEITPPLYFVLSWATAKLGHAPELVRLPSLIAGALTIPAVYALGRRTVGRPAALVATALTTLSPFMIYYATEARGYALLMALVVGSTLSMLLAVETGRRRWWAAYAVCSCAAAYTHYTGLFALLAQFLWLVWAHPEARRPALVANAVAVVGFLPWLSGLHNDLTSPTSKILSALSPFDLDSIRVVFEHWAVGYPYATLPLRRLPGVPALLLLAAATILAVAGLAVAARSRRRRRRPDRRLLLVLVLAASVPLGEMVVSAVSTNLFGVRNLAAAWPALALAFAALLVAAGRHLRWIAAGLAVAAFAIAAVKLLEGRYSRPDYRAAASFVGDEVRSGDVIVDQTAVLSPGPLSPLDVTLAGRHVLVRSAAPSERDHPFTLFDPIVDAQAAIDRAVKLARGHRIIVVYNKFPRSVIPPARRQAARRARFPSRYRIAAERVWPSFIGPLVVRVYAAR